MSSTSRQLAGVSIVQDGHFVHFREVGNWSRIYRILLFKAETPAESKDNIECGPISAHFFRRAIASHGQPTYQKFHLDLLPLDCPIVQTHRLVPVHPRPARESWVLRTHEVLSSTLTEQRWSDWD